MFAMPKKKLIFDNFRFPPTKIFSIGLTGKSQIGCIGYHWKYHSSYTIYLQKVDLGTYCFTITSLFKYLNIVFF